MKIYPAIDLKQGRVVQLVGGDPNQVAVEADASPAAQAIAWKEAGAKRLHVVDLDAAMGGARQWPLLTGIQRAGLPIQFGGGLRHMVDIHRLLEMGMERVIVGTQGIENPQWLEELAGLYPNRVVLAIDARGRDVAIKGWTETTGQDVVALAASLNNVPLAAFLYTNVDKEGRMEGIDEAIIRSLREATSTELIVSGGISSTVDLDTLARLGVDGVVLGMSVYTGAIKMEEAVKYEGP